MPKEIKDSLKPRPIPNTSVFMLNAIVLCGLKDGPFWSEIEGKCSDLGLKQDCDFQPKK